MTLGGTLVNIANNQLVNSSTILGNATLSLGGTVTTVGNVTLTNATISSVATTFPNSFLANNNVTIGNTSIALGGSTANIGNVTLSNVTIQGGSANVTTFNHLAQVSVTATYGNASLPLQPLGFINFDLNGTVVKVPYYSV